MNRLFSLLTVFAMSMAIPVMAQEHNVTFKWSYPEDQSSVINGFRIYDNSNPQAPKVIMTINNGATRTVMKPVELQSGANNFFIAPFIGDREGSPSNVGGANITPFYPITDFTVECPTCK